MSITIKISGETPAELIHALTTLAEAFGGGEAFRKALVGAQVAADEKSILVAVGASAAPTPEPPPATAAPPEAPTANVVKDLTPAEMRQKGSDMLLAMFNRDPTTSGVLSKIQKKYAVGKFSEIPDDKAQEFYNDALLAANGTGEVKAA